MQDVHCGYWLLTSCSKRKNLRPSTVLHTQWLWISWMWDEYTQRTFYGLPIEKCHQLWRAYYDLVMYVPCTDTQDASFLSPDVNFLVSFSVWQHTLYNCHSLLRLQEFCKVYKRLFREGKGAPAGRPWQHDNQFTYSMYLVNQHNREIRLDCTNKGVCVCIDKRLIWGQVTGPMWQCQNGK